MAVYETSGPDVVQLKYAKTLQTKIKLERRLG